MTSRPAPRGRRSAEPGRRSPLLDLLAPVRGPLLTAAALQAVAAVATVVPLVCVVEIARRLLDAPVDESAVHALVVVAVVAFAVRLVAHGAGGQITHLADNTFQLVVRRRIARHLGRLPLGWFGARHSGEVRRAVQDDVNAMHYMVAHSLPDLVAGVVTPVVALGYLVVVDWRLTLITVVPLVVFAVLYVEIVRGYGSQMTEHAARLGRIGSAVVELVQGIGVVKAFGPTGGTHTRYTTATHDFADFHEEWVRPIARRSALAELVCSPPVMLTVILAGGVARTTWGSMDPLDVVPFALLGLGLTQPLLTLGHSAQGFRLASEAAGRVMALLATPTLPDVAEGADYQPRPTGDGAVALDRVSFAYDDRADVLTDVTADLEPGTVTALVGPSGAGKSTLAALIPRFWDVRDGHVRVDGRDVRDVPAADLYRRVAFVFQDPGLLRASVAENIRLGRPDATDDEVRAAADAARIHDRIGELPRGYDSVVGVDARLSGGEAQRLAIARALLADRPILVLDEATAFADPESEAQIQDALSRLAAGRTVVVIAHRLSTITGADRILVLDGGRIVERGAHDELLAADGAYARQWAAHERAASAPLRAVADEPDRATGGAA
ncbi:MAG: ABC transporter ATP-binding protein/permease [Solirubrobacteraceae bacterium]|nr:ABC transporter ATP-binding protein/permease [Solirubrobacteraceae bacterium]